jgi:rhodanese-related sulfurtransferase
VKPKLGFRELVSRAEGEIESLTPAEVAEKLTDKGVVLVDLRDIRELKREGKIPGARHVPRGMLEFWIDPDSDYYKPYFAAATEIIFYCNLGWRSALATKTAQDMGFEHVKHMTGGFERWRQDIGQIDEPDT